MNRARVLAIRPLINLTNSPNIRTRHLFSLPFVIALYDPAFMYVAASSSAVNSSARATESGRNLLTRESGGQAMHALEHDVVALGHEYRHALLRARLFGLGDDLGFGFGLGRLVRLHPIGVIRRKVRRRVAGVVVVHCDQALAETSVTLASDPRRLS